MARLLLFQGRLDECITLIVQAGKAESVAFAVALGDAYAKKGNMAGAFDHLQKHLALEKEVFSEESRKRIEAFNIRMALAAKENEKEKGAKDTFEETDRLVMLPSP